MSEEESTVEVKLTKKDLEIQLIKEGIVRKNPDHDPQDWRSKAYLVDFEAAHELLLQHQAKTEPSVVKFNEDRIKSEGEKSFKSVIKAFVSHQLIPASSAVQIGRIIKPANILVHDEDFARFYHMDTSFPDEPAKRGTLELGIEYINGWPYEEIKNATTQAGLNFNDEQLFQLVLRNGISHEYGHAVEQAVLLSESERQSKIDKTPRESDWIFFGDIRKKIEMYIYKTIAPNHKLQELLAGQPEEGYAVARERTSSERVAVGFEYLGTRYALEELEVPNDRIDEIMIKLAKADERKLEVAKALIQLVTDAGLNLQDFADARLDIYSWLKDHDEVKLYYPLSFGFESRSLGYLFPLTENEIHKFVTEIASKSLSEGGN